MEGCGGEGNSDKGNNGPHRTRVRVQFYLMGGPRMSWAIHSQFNSTNRDGYGSGTTGTPYTVGESTSSCESPEHSNRSTDGLAVNVTPARRLLVGVVQDEPCSEASAS